MASPTLAPLVLDIIGAKDKLAFYERVTGISQLMIRRAQIHVMAPGGHVAYHRDIDSNTLYVAAVVLQFSAAAKGGEFMVHSRSNQMFRVKEFAMLMTQAELPHEVITVEKGKRVTLAFWLANK